MSPSPPATVRAVHRSADHAFSKFPSGEIELVAGLGVAGDCHLGARVQHLSRVRRDPTQPNLRQVHLLHEELFGEIRARGFAVGPGELGENVTTSGIDLLALPTGTLLRLGEEAMVSVTGLRNPCKQIDGLQDGLLATVLERADDGRAIRKAGVMAVVVQGGTVRAGDAIEVALPPEPRLPLEPV